MRSAVTRSLAILVGTGLACGVTLTVGALTPTGPARVLLDIVRHEVWPRTAKRLAEQGPERGEQIRHELEALGPHPWAGVYRAVFGDTLSLAPGAGFSWYHEDGCGNCAGHRALGVVRETDERRLTLEVDLESEESGWATLDGVLHLVPWGDLVFAVPGSHREDFCAQVLDGVSFPKAPFRIVRDDSAFDSRDPERPPGRPDLPLEFQPLVPDGTISGAVLSLLSWELHEPDDSTRVPTADVTYLVGLGGEDRLAVGMRLYVEAGGLARVTEVDARESRIRLVVRDTEKAWAEGLVGTRVTTARKPRTRLP